MLIFCVGLIPLRSLVGSDLPVKSSWCWRFDTPPVGIFILMVKFFYVTLRVLFLIMLRTCISLGALEVPVCRANFVYKTRRRNIRVKSLRSMTGFLPSSLGSSNKSGKTLKTHWQIYYIYIYMYTYIHITPYWKWMTPRQIESGHIV